MRPFRLGVAFLETEMERQRLESIDALRGLAMVLMALDHARDFWGNFLVLPEDLATTNPVLFATRWVTHFCAPVFVLLAGTSASLWGRGRGRLERARFLVTRGLWLIVLEFTLIHLAWFLDYRSFLHFQVIAAIGVALVVLGLLAWLPRRLVGLLGLLIVFGHNALTPLEASSFGAFGPVWQVLHDGGYFPIGSLQYFQVMYPVLPWIGVACLGSWMSELYGWEASRRISTLRLIGIGATIAFVLLRLTNLYGDPEPWEAQGSTTMTVVAFLRCGKYPPSLCFLLMTLGPALLLLAQLDRSASGREGRVPRPLGPLLTLGRVPLFFYFLHILVLHVSVALWYRVREGRFLISADVFSNAPEWYGNSLVHAYAAWILVVVALYPACRWYAGLKRRSQSRLLTYL